MKSFFIFLLKLLVSVALCYAVWRMIASAPGMDSDDFMDIAKGIDSKYLLFAAACVFASYFSGCLQWKLLLATQNVKMAYARLLRFYFAGAFFNNFMPGNVGGDLKKIYDIRQNSGETIGAAVSATVFDRLCGLYVLCFFALGVGAAFFWRDPEQRYFMLPSLMIFLCFSLGLCMLFSKRAGNLLFAKLFPFLGNRVLHLHGRFQAFRTGRLFAQLVSLSALTQFLRIMSHYFCALGIGVDIAVSWYFYYIPLVAIVSALPVSVGGFGPRELMAAELFGRAGVGAMEAVIVQLLAYIANLAVSLLGAAEFMLRHFFYIKPENNT